MVYFGGKISEVGVVDIVEKGGVLDEIFGDYLSYVTVGRVKVFGEEGFQGGLVVIGEIKKFDVDIFWRESEWAIDEGFGVIENST